MSPRKSPRRRRSQPSPRTKSWPRSAALWALRAAGAALVLQHIDLLVGRFADASIAEPLVLVRWLGAAALVGAAAELRRRGRAPWRGRTGLAFALVVLLLHTGGVAPAASNLADSLFVLPAGLLLAVAAACAAVSGRKSAAVAAMRARGARHFPDPPRVAASAGFRRLFASRPPPPSLVFA